MTGVALVVPAEFLDAARDGAGWPRDLVVVVVVWAGGA